MFSYRCCFIPLFAFLTQGINQSQQSFASLNDKMNENIANSLVLPEVSASFEESFFSWTSEFLQEFYSHIFCCKSKNWQCGNILSSNRIFYGLWPFLQFRQAYWCKGIIKKERFQLVLSFFLSRRSMRKNALKYVFDFMTFSSGNFNLITQAKANQSFSTLFHTK